MKPLAFNGAGIDIPEHWEPTAIGRGYLQAGDDGGPLADVRFEEVRGRFNMKKHLKRMRKRFGKKGEVKPGDAPPHLRGVPPGMDTLPFHFRLGIEEGDGLVIFDSESRMAAILRLQSRLDPDTGRQIAKSLRLHGSNEDAPLAAFDLRARIPSGAKLVEHAFQPGRYRVVYDVGPLSLAWSRFAPADRLLRDTDMAGFARTVYGEEIDQLDLVPGWTYHLGHPACEFRQRSTPSLVSRISRRASYGFLRLWHVSRANRILAVAAKSRRPLDMDLVDEVCAHYETVPQKED
jgi:hypothetical protein